MVVISLSKEISLSKKPGESGLSDILYQLQSSVMTDSYYFGKNKIIEKLLFIFKAQVGEGYLLMAWLDYQRNQSGLSLFDTQHIAAGPLLRPLWKEHWP